MSRSVPEWIGKTDDSRPPPRVKRRILERYDRTCHWSGVPIREGDEWDVEHIIALVNGGKNRESNMAPIRRGKAHREKTAQDMKTKSKITGQAYGSMRLKKRKGRGFRGWTRFDGTPVWKD